MPTYKEDLKLGREYPPDNEKEAVSQMLSDLMGQEERLYPTGQMLRQAHPKMHGCVKAEFIISDNIPADLKIGIFKEPKTFEAYIRFSNASTAIKPDSKKDIRGMGIKLLNVPGEKLLTDQPTWQDFILISHEVFVAKNAKQFSGTIKAITQKSTIAKILGFLHPSQWPVLAKTAQSFKKCEHILNTSFWSTTPYQYGDSGRAVKYFVSPANGDLCKVNTTTGDNYLRENMVKTLAEQDVQFDFHIQMQTDPHKMPIEDPTKKWNSPFIKVATIKIPKQSFDTDEMNNLGEALSFVAWHGLAEHRPLGGISRARKIIYEAMYQLRAQRNNFNEASIFNKNNANLDNSDPGANNSNPGLNNSNTDKMATPTNVEIVQQMFASYLKDDIAGVMANFSPDIVWTEPGAPDVQYAGVYKGTAGIEEMLGLEAKLLDVKAFNMGNFFSNGNQVVVLGDDTTTVKSTGKDYTTQWTMVFALADGKITSVQTYMDTNAVAKAFIAS